MNDASLPAFDTSESSTTSSIVTKIIYDVRSMNRRRPQGGYKRWRCTVWGKSLTFLCYSATLNDAHEVIAPEDNVQGLHSLE